MSLVFSSVFTGAVLVTVSLAFKTELKPQYRIGSLLPDEETRVKDGEYPYVVAISMKCTGTIVAPQWVLTAGHCYDPKTLPDNLLDLFNEEVKNSTVFYGSPNKELAKQVRVVDYKLHPDYYLAVDKYGLPLHDIALLQLEHPVDVQPIQLAREPLRPHENVIAMGFGLYRRFNPAEFLDISLNLLRKANLITDSVCHDDLICSKTSSESICEGDSGGPLIKDNMQYGVVHGAMTRNTIMNIPVCLGPSWFVSVLPYLDWITQTTQSK